jgi:tripartite-type tricarboxylate transporter receptor subunit TctC
MINKRQAGLALATLVLSLSAVGTALAQSYPDKPIRLVVPYPPGASTDAVGRIVGQKLSANIGTEFVGRSAPDGYTFVMGTDATHASNSFLTANPTFDPIKDFTPLAIVAMNPIALVVHPSVPAKDLNELVAWLKANPGKGGFGSSGTGSPHHLAGELLKARTGAPLIHVPYRGGGPALNDLMGGQISLLFASAITVVPHIQSGKVKAIALTSAKRSGILPNVPTMGESLDGFEMPSWLAFFGPAKMPDAVTRRLSDELVKVLSDPDVRARLTAAGMDVVAGGQAELTELQRREYQSRGKLIRDANIKGE